MTPVRHHTEIGGYPLFCIITSDDGHFVACPSCVNQNKVGKNITCNMISINWEDSDLTCEVCEDTIDSAY